MSTNLFELEMANLEDAQLHKPADLSENKRSTNHRKLAARRAIEDHLEQRRFMDEFGLDDDEIELYS